MRPAGRAGLSGAMSPSRSGAGRASPLSRSAKAAVIRSSTCWCSTRPAAVTTIEGIAYRPRYQPSTSSRLSASIDATVPSTERPSGVSPKSASENRSCTASEGSSSRMAISSSTTVRSDSRSSAVLHASVTRSDSSVTASGRSLARTLA